MKKKKQTVIIVGGGAAGLMAAKNLSGRYKVVVLEAAERVGGRIHTMQASGFTKPIEAGAEFVHGKLPLTLKCLKKGGIAYHQTAGRFYHAGEEGVHQPRGRGQEWDELLKRMKKERHDMEVQRFLEKYYAGEEHHELWEQVRGYAEGFDVADIRKASMKALYDEWSKEDHAIYRIEGGYGKLINYLEEESKRRGVEIIANQAVSRIDWTKNKVIVYTRTNEHYAGEKCVVTAPLYFLDNANTSSIQFNPSLPGYADAAAEIGYGNVIKIIIEFNEPFWNDYAKGIGFILSDQAIPTWWTQLPDPVPLLTGWRGGAGAKELSNKSDEDILQLALTSLANIFQMPVETLQQKIVASRIFNWLSDEHAKGAYSYAYPSSEKARRKLNEPVADTIFFAGEALYKDQPGGTVEAGLISGRDAARKIKKADVRIKKFERG